MREGAYCAGSVARDQLFVEVAGSLLRHYGMHFQVQRWARNLKLDKRNSDVNHSAVRTGWRVVNFALSIRSQNFPSVTIIRCLLDLPEE